MRNRDGSGIKTSLSGLMVIENRSCPLAIRRQQRCPFLTLSFYLLVPHSRRFGCTLRERLEPTRALGCLSDFDIVVAIVHSCIHT